MTRSLITCRTCRQTIVVKHEDGRHTFKAAVEEYVERWSRLRLRCGCGTRRDWTLPSGRDKGG